MPTPRTIIRRHTCQLPSHIRLRLADGSIIIDRKHTDGALTSHAQNLRLAGQRAVAVNTGIEPCAQFVLVVERLGRGVVRRKIRQSAAGQAGLDKRRVDAGVVGQARDVWRVYI